MKRIISIILVVAMIIGFIPSMGEQVFATETGSDGTIQVEQTYGEPGDTVDVNVIVKNNPGILGMTLKVTYDESKVTLVSVTNGEALSYMTFTTPKDLSSGCKLPWATEAITEEDVRDGVIATLTFEISEDAVPNELVEIGLSYENGAIIDNDLVSLYPEIINDSIWVLDYTPGDLNEDGYINTTDVVYLMRYIAGGYDVTINESAADVNDDGYLNTTDVVYLMRYIAGGYDVKLKPSTPKCSHTMQAVEAKSATCTEEGNDAYWYCSVCEKCFADEAGATEIAREDTIIAAKGHSVVIDEAVAPTPTTEGLTEGSHCSVCGLEIVAQEVIPPTILETHEIVYDIANGDPYLEELLEKGEIVNPNANYYEEGVGLTLVNLSVAGYRFLGWYDLAENGTLIKKINTDETENYQLYAYWSKIEYTVQYKSSLFVDRAQDTYTVDTGLVLPTPKLSNYTFTGWADEDGNLYSDTMIPVGTTENLVLEANWTSERNKTWTKNELDDPIMYTEDNTLFFVYEIGEIQNVPLYTIKDFGYIAEGGVEKSEETTFSMVISEGTATQIAESVEKATTSSSNWTLSSGWTDSTSISQEWLDEKGYEEDEVIGYATNEESNWNISTGTNGSTDTSTGTSNEKGWTNEAKINSSNSTTESSSINAGLESTLGVEEFGIKAEISATLEAEESTSNTKTNGFEVGGSDSNTDLTTTNTTTSSGWSNSSSYGGSKSSSENHSISTSVSEVVTEKYGYGEEYTSEYTSGESQGLEFSNKGTEEWSSSVTYNVETAEAVTRSWTTEQTKAGYHRWIMAGIAHVFAVVAYDMETQSYYVYTYTVMDDTTYEYEDYSYTSATYNDHENGVISFEIPYEVAEYVAEKTAYTQGLKVDQETGTITGYTGEDNCVVIPEYMNVGDGDVVKITGLAEGVFQNNTNISAVVLSDYITEIPNDCFNGCTNLEGVIGGTITRIGDRAFAGTSIVDCVVRSQVTFVGDNAFANVDRVYFNCANAQVLQAADNCGAKKICVNLAYMSDITAANDIELSIPQGTEYFELNGNGETVTDMIILSDANETVFYKINLVGTSAIPVKISSETVVLNQSSIYATGIALVLSAEQTDLYLQSTINITSENQNAVLCKSVDLYEWNQNVDGRLSFESKLLYVENIGNTDLISEGQWEKISADDFDNMLNSYTLYFDANGGVCDEASRSVPNSTKIGTLPVPTREHYTFEGWFLEDGSKVTEDSVFSTGIDITVSAKWTAVPYTVSWNTGTGYSITVNRTSSPYVGAPAGVLYSGDTIYYGDVLSISYIAHTGYTLSGQGSTSITVIGDVTASSIYASATVNSYMVSWNTGTGYSIVVNRTSSPYAGAPVGVLYSGDTIYYGDVLSISYVADTGYSVTNHGVTYIEITGDVDARVIYADVQVNSYTYNIVYISSNGTALGTSSATYEYGTTNTIYPPEISGYYTPASQSVAWDSTGAKTITFTYYPIEVATSQYLWNGWWWRSGTSDYGVCYDVHAEYQNRTADSVQIRLVWKQAINQAQYGFTQQFYASFWHNGTQRANTGDVLIATASLWPQNGSWHTGSTTAYSDWITVSLDTTNATTVVVNCDWWSSEDSGSWADKILSIPAY